MYTGVAGGGCTSAHSTSPCHIIETEYMKDGPIIGGIKMTQRKMFRAKSLPRDWCLSSQLHIRPFFSKSFKPDYGKKIYLTLYEM